MEKYLTIIKEQSIKALRFFPKPSKFFDYIMQKADRVLTMTAMMKQLAMVKY